MDRKLLGTIAASSALGIGIGLQRTQFAVLGEIMSDNHWFQADDIGLLSGLSIGGYIVGCIHQTSIKNEMNNIRVVRIGLALAVISFFIEPLTSNLSWQVIWRIIGGWASAQLVTGIPGLGIRYHAIDEKRRALAYIFAGAGIAALIGSILVSLMASTSIIESWIVTGILAIALALPIHSLLDHCIEEELIKRYDNEKNPAVTASKPATTDSRKIWTRGLVLLALSTLFFGAGQATILTYYPLLLVSKFHISEAAASASYANVGLGYTIGAIASGYMPKKLSTDKLMTTSGVIGVIGTLTCAIGPDVSMVGLGGFAFAFWNGSMMGLLLHRINLSVPQELSRLIWSNFSLILSIGFLAFTLISSPFANQQVMTVIWLGVALAAIHLSLQILAKQSFRVSMSQQADG